MRRRGVHVRPAPAPPPATLPQHHRQDDKFAASHGRSQFQVRAQGFDKFYGFLGGETNQWAPLISDGMNQVELPKDPNYHFMTDMTDMTDKAIAWTELHEATWFISFPRIIMCFLHVKSRTVEFFIRRLLLSRHDLGQGFRPTGG